MASARQAPRWNSKKRTSVDLHQADESNRSTRPASDTLLSELAELLREMHQLLQDYAPPWYTQAMDDRIREKLAAAPRASAAFLDRE